MRITTAVRPRSSLEVLSANASKCIALLQDGRLQVIPFGIGGVLRSKTAPSHEEACDDLWLGCRLICTSDLSGSLL